MGGEPARAREPGFRRGRGCSAARSGRRMSAANVDDNEPVTEILILKTAALGDVLRTTSILPGLVATNADSPAPTAARPWLTIDDVPHAPDVRVTWVTAPAAVDLIRTHPLVDEVVAIDVKDPASVDDVARRLESRKFERVVSLDDEEPLCRLASKTCAARLSGAYETESGERAYTPDVAPWFDMGLLSVHGKARADAMKVANRRSQPEIYASMLGVPMGKPALVLPSSATEASSAFARARRVDPAVPLVGLNTGAGGRWTSKQLPVDRTVALAKLVASSLSGRVRFLVLGGDAEEERNRAILDGIGDAAIDGGTRNTLLDFAARVELCDVLVTSDSLALHMAVARDTRLVAFFAPTSAAEIELYGLGEKIVSTSDDYCSYRADADNRSITPERLGDAVLRQLGKSASA